MTNSNAALSDRLFKVGPVYVKNLSEAKAAVFKTLVNQGGTSSAKTYSILQVLFTIASEYVYTEEDDTCVITVVGQDIPNLKRGALRQALQIYKGSALLQSLVADYNKTDRKFTFHNGAEIEFNSYSDEQDARSGKRDYLFINEANGISYEIYWQLAIRCKHRVWLDFNPTSRFWCHEKVIGRLDKHGNPMTLHIISDHRHNDFLTQEQHDEIEAIKEYDYQLWRVYARGATGRIEGIVYPKWDVAPIGIPEHARLVAYGVDFGFTNDPTVLVAVWIADGVLYLDELIYEHGLTSDDIHDRLLELGIDKKAVFIADSADPKTIKELQNKGWKGFEPAEKGPDSILFGINILKKYTVYMTQGSMNLRKEQGSYKWATDKQTGMPLNKPIDKFNHLLDAVRYVALNRLTTMKRKGKAHYGWKK